MARKKLVTIKSDYFVKAALYLFKGIGCFLFLLLLLFNEKADAQQSINQISVYGIIKDNFTGEVLPFANIFETSKKQYGTSNDYGFYSIKLNKGIVNMRVSYIGYQTVTLNFPVTSDTLINIRLNPLTQKLNEVVITDSLEKTSANVPIGIKTIPIQQANHLPAILGEVDLLKTIQLLPGVQSGHEGSSGIFVRGGEGDQNLYIIDGVTVYSVVHLLGFVSVFNEDAVSSMKIYSGGFPARFHGRLSSVIDIKTREGNLNKYEGGLSIGLLSAKFNVNGPIKRGNGSFFVSGRRSYIDWLVRPVIKDIADGAVVKLNFYDLNGKINYIITKKDHLYFSLYFGKDNYGKHFEQSANGNSNDQDREGLKWGNFVTSLRWNHIWNNKLFSKLSISYTDYNYLNERNIVIKSASSTKKYFYQFNSGINDVNLKLLFDYYLNNNHTLKAGIGGTYHTFVPGITLESNLTSDTTYGYKNMYSPEFNVFAEDKWMLNNKFIIMSGISVSLFNTDGRSYFFIEPRLSVNYLINKKLSLKAAYSKMSQFVHLLRFSTINLPTDLWIPSSSKLSPEVSNQITIGASYIYNSIFDISVEAYYKSLSNLVEYKEGTSLFKGNESFENYIETGKGKAYGIEFMIKKQHGRLNGWVSYTLSKSTRLFSNINQGSEFPFRFDRRHDLSVVGTYKVSKTIDAGFTWVFGSGYPVTMHTDKYASYFLSVFNGKYAPSPNSFASVNYFPYRNNYRMPAFHHLDINFNFHKNTKYGERIFTVGIYNVYNRLNAFYLKEEDGKLYKVSLFPITPFIRFTIKFY